MERKIGESAREESEATQRCVLPAPEEDDVVIENDQMKLVIGANAIVKSLLFKPTGEACLITGKNVPISAMVQPRPYQNEVKLAYFGS